MAEIRIYDTTNILDTRYKDQLMFCMFEIAQLYADALEIDMVIENDEGISLKSTDTPPHLKEELNHLCKTIITTLVTLSADDNAHAN